MGCRPTRPAIASTRSSSTPLDKPVTVTFEGKKYVLSPDELQLRADINGMVDSALAASRSGGFPTRVWRYATGGSVDREIAPQITYSADALDGFVDEVAKQIDRAPQDATVAPTPTSLNTVPGQDGVTVLTGDLRSRLRAAIDSPQHRTVSAAGQADEARGHHRPSSPRSTRSS